MNDHCQLRQSQIIGTIKDLLERKQSVDLQISEIEARVCQLESEYLAETRPYGNIFKGLAGYMASSNQKNSNGGAPTDHLSDRPFSAAFLASTSTAMSPPSRAPDSPPKRASRIHK